MKTTNQFTLTTAQLVLGAALAFSGILAIALPSQAHAATYAFVNNAGEVSIVAAESPTSALATAFNIALHSGVMLLLSQTDGIIGDRITL